MAEREYKKELTPERRARIVEWCVSQLSSMLAEAEGWYPDKAVTSARLRAEHGSYCDRLGSLAIDMGYSSFAELLRNEGFDIELDRRAAAHPVGHRIAPEDAVEHIVESVTGRLGGYFERIDGWYPDRVVTDFAKLHDKTKESLSRNARALGYESWADLLRDHGYEVPDYAGPSFVDPAAILDELARRYEGREPAASIEALRADNPDLASKFTTLNVRSRKVFGDTLAKVLADRGIVREGRTTVDPVAILDELARRYEGHEPAADIKALRAENPDLAPSMATVARQSREVFGDTLAKVLADRGVIQGAVDPIAVLDELVRRYEGRDPEASIEALRAENPDLAASIATVARQSREVFGDTLAKVLSDRGVIQGAVGPAAVLDELARRYEGREPAASIEALKAENPDLAPKFKNMEAKSRELFGDTLARALATRGIVREGRTTVDPVAVLDELARRYEGREPAASVEALKAENPDLASKIPTLSVRSREVFGDALSKVLVDRGIIRGMRSAVDPAEVLDELARRYEGREPAASVEALKAENPDLASKFSTLSTRSREVFGDALSKVLADRGIIRGMRSAANLVDVLDELARRYDGREPAADIKALRAENPDLAPSIGAISSRSRELFGDTLAKVLADRGIIGKPAEAVPVSDITPERRARIAERCGSQLSSMLAEAEGWYPDKVVSSAQLKAEHESFCDRLGSLAIDMGYSSFAELLRNEGFDIELDRRAAAHPVGHRIAPEDATDHIVWSVTGRLQGYFDKIDGWYPDRVVTDFAKLHDKTKGNLSRNAQALGYETWADLLRDHGYEVPDYDGPKGGRKATLDPEAIFAELMDRYEGLEKPKTIGILMYENPDLKGNLKSIQNMANELFGHTITVELKERGLIAGGPSGAVVSEDDIREMLEKLSAKYAQAPIRPNTIAELKADNPDYKGVIAEFNDRCRMIFGTTPRRKLVELGIFAKPKGAVIDATEEEIWQAVDDISKLVFELPDADKPKTLTDLQNAYPELGEYIKAGKVRGILDKGPLQELGILAPTKALLKKEGIRRAPVGSLTDDYGRLGLPQFIMPGSSDGELLPFGVIGLDADAQIELRECIATVKGESAKNLSLGDEIAFSFEQLYRDWGEQYTALIIETIPETTLDTKAMFDGALNSSDSALSSYVGGEVISVASSDEFHGAQIRIRYLSILNRDTLAYVMRQSGAVTKKDLLGSMEWRYRVRNADAYNQEPPQPVDEDTPLEQSVDAEPPSSVESVPLDQDFDPEPPIVVDDDPQEQVSDAESPASDGDVSTPVSWDDFDLLGDADCAFMSDNSLTDRQKEYLKTIADLSREFPHVRSSDVVERAGCSKAAFSSALQKLVEAGCVSVDDGYIRLLNNDRNLVSRTLAKYIDVIEELHHEPPRIRSIDAVAVLGCSRGNFSDALREFKDRGLVVQKDGYIMLASSAIVGPTEKGAAQADDHSGENEESPAVDRIETPEAQQIIPNDQTSRSAFDDEEPIAEAPDLKGAARNYFDKIAEFAANNEMIRSYQLAGLMGVSSTAVSKMLRILKDSGLVETDIDGVIRLTEKGCNAAHLTYKPQVAPDGRAFMTNPDISASQKKYLSAIADIAEAGTVVRATDVADRLGVSKASVSKMLGGLRDAGYIEVEGRSITLTPLATGVVPTIIASNNADKEARVHPCGLVSDGKAEDANDEPSRWTFNEHKLARGRRFSVEVPDQFVLTPEENGRPLARYEAGVDDLDECPAINYGMSAGDLDGEIQETYRKVFVPEARIEMMRDVMYSNDMLNSIMQTVGDWVVEGKNCKVLVVEFRQPDIFGQGNDSYEYHVKPVAYDHEDFLRLADSWNHLGKGELREVALSIAETLELDRPVELLRPAELDKMCSESVGEDSFRETVTVIANILNLGASKRMNANTYREARRANNDKSVWLAGDTLPRIRAEAFNESLVDDVAYYKRFIEALEKQAELGSEGFDGMLDMVREFAEARLVDHISMEDEEDARAVNALGIISLPKEVQSLNERLARVKPAPKESAKTPTWEEAQAQVKAKFEAEAEARRKAEEEAEARAKAEAEARAKPPTWEETQAQVKAKFEAEAEARRKAEEEARRAEEEARHKAEEEERRRREQAARFLSISSLCERMRGLAGDGYCTPSRIRAGFEDVVTASQIEESLDRAWRQGIVRKVPAADGPLYAVGWTADAWRTAREKENALLAAGCDSRVRESIEALCTELDEKIEDNEHFFNSLRRYTSGTESQRTDLMAQLAEIRSGLSGIQDSRKEVDAEIEGLEAELSKTGFFAFRRKGELKEALRQANERKSALRKEERSGEERITFLSEKLDALSRMTAPADKEIEEAKNALSLQRRELERKRLEAQNDAEESIRAMMSLYACPVDASWCVENVSGVNDESTARNALNKLVQAHDAIKLAAQDAYALTAGGTHRRMPEGHGQGAPSKAPARGVSAARKDNERMARELYRKLPYAPEGHTVRGIVGMGYPDASNSQKVAALLHVGVEMGLFYRIEDKTGDKPVVYYRRQVRR